MKKLADLFSGYRLILTLIVFSMLLLGGFFVFAKLTGSGVKEAALPATTVAQPALPTVAKSAAATSHVPTGSEGAAAGISAAVK